MDNSATTLKSLLGPLAGGTKKSEYRRTIELLNEIWSKKGAYYAMAFLFDSGYDRDDIKAIMELLHPVNGEYRDKSRKACGTRIIKPS